MMPLAFSFRWAFPVTTSAAVVPRVTCPALVEPVGGAKLIDSVTPAGMALSMAAVILPLLAFAVIA